jgi:outer membrane protein
MQSLVKQNKLSYEASKMTLQQRKDNLTLDIILAYLRVLNNEDLLADARNRADLSRRQVERLDVLNREGAVRPSDFSDLKGQYAGDQLSVVNNVNALETSKITLCQLMNVPYNKDFSLERLDKGSGLFYAKRSTGGQGCKRKIISHA